jgi:heme-degrading monooxygenase HmoA
MVRIMYRWTVKPGEEDQFIRDWREGTRRIQANCAGAHGSYLTRSMKEPQHFFGTARWESAEAWRAAQPVMMKLNLPGRIPETADFYEEIAEIVRD